MAPIFKEKNKASVECYRSISLLRSASKVFDNINPKVQPLLENSQYGFRQKRSAILQMVQFLSKVYEFYDDKNVQTLSVLYIYFSKAFVKVPYSFLIAKLRNIGLGIQIQDIIQDYLTDRRHFADRRHFLTDRRHIGKIILSNLSETLSKLLFFSSANSSQGKQIKWPQFLQKKQGVS